jgi:membrane fusion protein, copper/silver efflux system
MIRLGRIQNVKAYWIHMKKLPYLLALVAVIVVAYLAGSLSSRRSSVESAGTGKKAILYYHCPMHPSFKSDKPGDAPCCGMKLVPVYAGEENTDAAPGQSDPAGTIRIGPEKQQLIGVKTASAETTSGMQTFRLLGRVSTDETCLYKIKASVDGIIREVYPGTVGSFIKKGQPLASYYSPDIFQAEQGYLIALSSDRYKSNLQVQVTESRLQFLGMSAQQTEELKKTQRLSDEIVLRSPATGFIIAREVSPDLVFEKGEELYRIADLSRIWIFADVFENEARQLNQGVKVKVFHPQSGMQFSARVSNVLPQFDPVTRTLKVRMEAENPDLALRPDMFVDVEFSVNNAASLTVPADAVIDSGRRKTVYVERASGLFEPRQVETGRRLGDRVQITRGLENGERVVVSSNFLIDSESRMRMTAEEGQPAAEKKMTVKDPVCGMDVDPQSSKVLKSDYKGETYYFCAEMCKKKFDATPVKYAKAKPASETGGAVSHKMPMAQNRTMVKDPVCGMDVDPMSPGILKGEYSGETYYFCGEMCKKKFDANPGAYARKKPAAAAAAPVSHQVHEMEKRATAKDPVCGMDVDPNSANVYTAEYKGETYYFCAESCKKSFEANPSKYLQKSEKSGHMHEMGVSE